MRALRLRTWMGLLLGLAAVMTFFIVGCVLLLYRLPQIENMTRAEMQVRAESVSNLLDHYTSSVEAQLAPLAALSGDHPLRDMQAYLDAVVRDGAVFEVAFIVAPSGQVQAVGLPEKYRQAAPVLRGADFSMNPFFHEVHHALVRSKGAPIALWSDRYLSVLSGKNTVGVAVAAGESIVIGEVSLERVLDMLSSSADAIDSVVSILDSRGQWLSSSRHDAPGQFFNFASLPVFLAIVSGKPLPEYEEFLGQRHVVGGVLSKKLQWVIAATAPAGWGDAKSRITVYLVLSGFVGALLVSLLLAPLGASHVARLVQPLIEHSHRIAGGEYPDDWPRSGFIHEVNRLSGDLRRMVDAMRSREQALRQNEQKLETIFHASPSAMLVCDAARDLLVIDVNAAWEQQFRRRRGEVVGVAGGALGLWVDSGDQERFNATLRAGGAVEAMEAWLYLGDGQRMLARISARIAQIGNERLLLITSVDMTEQRRIEREILDLNKDLEARVALRTGELSLANEELEATVESLKATQAQLVQSEKIASLGSMVAGVAHELNTPVGNALMATSTLGDRLREFHERKSAGLRRSDLEAFIEVVDSACQIAERNLHRAADLVGSFKQVAVDQSSDQRRRFGLSEVVREIVLTLQPSLRRTPYQVVTTVPEGLLFDSYPGALGQVLTNLINNAVLHAFSGREQGRIRIAAAALADDLVELSVSDDGCGIPADAQKRIFDPFFTTRLGRGGSGLGLHITHNAVTRILGGSIVLSSAPGEGAVFVIRLPLVAPQGEAKSASDFV